MYKEIEGSRQLWMIYVEDRNDPALWQFDFPVEADEWLKDPQVCLNRLTAVRELFPFFTDRLQQFVAQGQVQVACWAEINHGSDQPVLPGFDHVAVLGPDGPKDPGGKGPLISVAFPLTPPKEPPPSWEAFPLVSPELRAACEQLAGVALGGLYCFGWPVILPWTKWSNWQRQFPTWDLNESSVIIPRELQASDAKLWALQHTYFSVVTLLREPGHLVQVLLPKGYKVRVLEEMTLQDWLAAELERGTPSQNQGFADDPESKLTPSQVRERPWFYQVLVPFAWALFAGLVAALFFILRACGD